VRYLKQRNPFSCGPIAIINAIRWAGGVAPYEKIHRLKKECVCIPKWGCPYAAFDRTLRKEGKGLFKVKRKYRPTIAKVTSHLLNGGAVILDYRTGPKLKNRNLEERHMYLIVEASPFGLLFGVVNRHVDAPAFDEITIMLLKEDFKHRRSDPLFKAWFLTKEG